MSIIMNMQSRFLTAKQVSELLCIPLRTIHRLSKQGRIKSVKIGGRWYYQKSEIERYLSFGTLAVDRKQEQPERRAYARMNCYLPCSFSVDLSHRKETGEGIIRNIGGGGVLMTDCGPCVSLEDPVSVRFVLGDAAIEADGRVVRKAGDGFGVKFRDIEKQYQDLIIGYVG